MSNRKIVLVTGSAGLIGSEAVSFFCKNGFEVIGIDNNMRAYFFGEEGSTKETAVKNIGLFKNYKHYNADIRDGQAIENIFKKHSFDLIIHTAAQPSHDWAAKEPQTDFSVNANGTLMLLENFRKYSPEAVFIFTSTNKVYGDTPNYLPLIEKETRFEIDPSHKYKNGISEDMSLDNSTHSLFGVSKTAADLMVQEYGRYFHLKTGVFRGGCLTGSGHAGVQQHGFLSYLVKCILTGQKYNIFGYKGKQVRDNIHAYDLINAFHNFYLNPKEGEVYNIGGSRFANISIIEAIKRIEQISNRETKVEYVDQNRIGDHIWYVSDVSKFKKDYPDWDYKYDIDATIEDICRNSSFGRKVFSFALAKNLDYWKEKNWYYHKQLKQIFKDSVKENSKVLQIGYGLGDIIADLYPKKGVGFDDDSNFVAISRKRYPNIKFSNFDFTKNKVQEQFDYIIFPDSLEHMHDIQTVFENIQPALNSESRVVIAALNPKWEPIFEILERLKLKRPEEERNWLKLENIKNLLEVSGFKILESGYRIILPAYIPFLSNFLNEKIKKIKFLSSFCVEQYIVAKKDKLIVNNNLSSSVIVPTLSGVEEIEELISQIPKLGKETDIIIVDGSGKNVNKNKRIFKQKNVKFIKTLNSSTIEHLVREGIDAADSDIVITYDELQSIPPEELSRFYNLLASGKASFVQGLRLVYPIKGQPFRQLNIIGNIVFSSIYSLVLGQRVKDLLTLVKGFYLKDYKKVQISDKDIFLDLLIKIGGEGRIKEIPVHYNSKSYFTYRKKTLNRVLSLIIGLLNGIWYLRIYSPIKKNLR